MKKIVRLTEADLTRIVKRVISEQNNATSGNTQTQVACPDPKNPDSYPGVRYYKGVQGLLNKLFNSGLVVDDKLGPKTSEALKKYILSKKMTPVVGTKEFAGPRAGLIDTSFNGNKELSNKLFGFLVQDGLKTFIPPAPKGCQKFKFDN
jgi:hypothetical protein